MIKSREFAVNIATVKPEYTAVVEGYLLQGYGGLSLNIGTGLYTFQNGKVIREPNATFTVATSKPAFLVNSSICTLAKVYCKIASQESIYFRDIDGFTWLIFANGERSSL